MKKASDGDKNAFDFLVQRYTRNMVTIAQIYTGYEADDIVQNAWVKIYERKEVLKTVQNIENWLFYVVKNQCMDFLRKNKKQGNISGISIDLYQKYIDSLVHGDDVLEIILKRRSNEELHRKITELGELYYMPIILHYFRNLNLKEISGILGISISTVKGRLYIGRQLLKKALTNNQIIIKGK
ncbi:MAG: RNA polymerase sigma factor [Oscillospiraceae bacterium]|nr:RNA polymerase sigma factor [Oscillospiraceae bacterium]